MEHFQTFHPTLGEVGEKTFQQAEVDLIKRLTEANNVTGSGGTGMLYIAALHAAAGLNYLARAMARGDTPEDKIRNACKETMLAAGLLAARIAIPTGEGVHADFSPRNVIASIEAAKLVSSNPAIEEYFDPDMVEAFRGGCVERDLTYGYWDYLETVGPSFDGFGASISGYTKH